MKKRLLALFAVMLLGLAAWINSSDTEPGRLGAGPVTASDLIEAVPPTATPLPVVAAPHRAWTSRAAAQTTAPAVIAESYLDAYPGLGDLVSDWRDFYRQAELITIAPYADIPLEFKRVHVRDEGRAVVWYGTHQLIPGSSVVVVSSDRGGKDVVVQLPGSSQFSIRTDRDGRTTVEEYQPGEEGCGAHPAQQDRNSGAEQVAAMPFPDFIRNGVGHDLVPQAMAANAQAITSISDAPASLKVDVLFLYDAATLDHARSISSDPVGYIEGQSRARLETANVVLAQSGVTNFQWRLVGLLGAPPEIPVFSTLSSYLTALSSGAVGEWVRTQRYDYGADQVLFWKGAAPSDYAGIAYSSKQTPVAKDSALSVSLWGTSAKTMIHELAHNFGCGHDRETASAPDSDGFHAYGQMFTTPAPYGGTFRASSIMGYGTYVVPYFSNPEIEIHVNAAAVEASTSIDWGMRALGVPIGQPRAAYNAKVLRDNAGAVAANAEEIETPAFTAQPAGATVGVGGYFSLSASATGGGLRYQWFRNGEAIAGALANTYSKHAAQSDGGTYTLQASNRAGTITSKAVDVTVSASAAPSPSNPSSGGGGGGGGAPSLWFLAAMSAAAALRAFRAQSRGAAPHNHVQ